MQSQVSFNRVPQNIPEKVPGSRGAKPSQVQWIPGKVAEVKPGEVHCTHGNLAEVFPALGFPASFRQSYKIKRCGYWGYHRSLFKINAYYIYGLGVSR